MLRFAKQRSIERAARAARNVGLKPIGIECYPDGKVVLCFDGGKSEVGDDLEAELKTWRRTRGTP